MDRNESIQDQIATVIQAGHRDHQTSYDTAAEVCALLAQLGFHREQLPLVKSGN